MQAALFLIAFAAILFCIWGFFLALGPQTGGLLAANADREMWLSAQSPAFIRTQNLAAIVGPLVSFATVISFYLGDARKYGVFVGAALLSLFLSYNVTNRMTTRIVSQERFRRQTIDADQVGAVIAKMFWSHDSDDQRLSRLVKIISLASIIGIVWLEFAFLGDFLGRVTGYELPSTLALLFVLSFLVCMFTTKYGIRGFAFAELILVPIVAACFLLICAAAIGIWIVSTSWDRPPLTAIELLRPKDENPNPYLTSVLFGIHVFAVNLFLPVVAESHWIRLWTFKELEIKMQKAGMALAAALAIPLVIAGWFIYYIYGGVFDESVMVLFVTQLTEISPFLGFIFWLAAVAALFSVANIQIYAGLIMFKFSPETGRMSVGRGRPIIMSMVLACAFCLLWYIVRSSDIRFDKLVITIGPSALVVLPALADAARRVQPSVLKVWIAGLGYWGAAIFGLLSPDKEIYGNLAAVMIPVAVSAFPVRRHS